MLVGITGCIGAGKTTLAGLLEAKGAVMINADRIGHEIVETDQVKGQLVERFGSHIVDEAGVLDRRALGRMAFADDAAKEDLERIVRPGLSEKLWGQVDEARCRAGTQGIVVVDAALIIEWGHENAFDRLVVVTAKNEDSISRVKAERGLSSSELRQRMKAQLPSSRKEEKADFVIDNSGDIEVLHEAANELWQELIAASRQGGART